MLCTIGHAVEPRMSLASMLMGTERDVRRTPTPLDQGCERIES